MKIQALFAILSLACCTAQAQTPVLTDAHLTSPFTLGVVDNIKSTELGETRTLNIYLPDGYTADTAKYPVIYLLDGSANEDFVHTVGLVQFLTMIQFMPPTIVVGIANVNRKRDFTHPTALEKYKKMEPAAGGSAKFMAFIENELQPYIAKNYHTNGVKTLIGQSLGGLMASEILLKKPGLFNKYIIVSPSLWWDDESMLKQAPEYIKQHGDHKLEVYISVGTEGKQMETVAAQLAKYVKARKNTTVHFAPLPKETHLTILHNSLYKAFELLNRKP